MGLSFDILIFDCLLKAPQPIAGLFLINWMGLVYAEGGRPSRNL